MYIQTALRGARARQEALTGTAVESAGASLAEAMSGEGRAVASSPFARLRALHSWWRVDCPNVVAHPLPVLRLAAAISLRTCAAAAEPGAAQRALSSLESAMRLCRTEAESAGAAEACSGPNLQSIAARQDYDAAPRQEDAEELMGSPVPSLLGSAAHDARSSPAAGGGGPATVGEKALYGAICCIRRWMWVREVRERAAVEEAAGEAALRVAQARADADARELAAVHATLEYDDD